MKKIIFTLLLSLYGIIALHAQPGYRNVDLAAYILSPKDSSFYKLPNKVYAQFVIKNLGPDTVYAHDTLWYKAFVSIFSGNIYRKQIGKILYPGDSIIVLDTFDFLDQPDLLDKYVRMGFIIPPTFINKNLQDPKGPFSGYDFALRANNYDTIYLAYRLSTSGITRAKLLQNLLYYPNPIVSNSVLNFDKVVDNTTVQILDMQGKIVMEGKIINKAFQLDNLKAGLYLINIDGFFQKEKLMITTL